MNKISDSEQAQIEALKTAKFEQLLNWMIKELILFKQQPNDGLFILMEDLNTKL